MTIVYTVEHEDGDTWNVTANDHGVTVLKTVLVCYKDPTSAAVVVNTLNLYRDHEG